MHHHRILKTLMLFGLATTSFATTPVAAKPKPKVVRASEWNLRGLDPFLADLPLGKNRAALVAWVQDRIDREYLPIIAKASDFAEKERIRARKEKEVEDFSASELAFAGATTQWESSIITHEFGIDSGESVIIWREPNETHFFFLAGGTFWKYARQLPLGEAWDARVERLSQFLGEPDAQAGSAPDGAVERIWRGRDQEMRVVDRRVMYGGDLLVLQHPGVLKTLEPKRAEAAAKRGPKAEQRTGIEEFLLEE
jgi:hypothetical protein